MALEPEPPESPPTRTLPSGKGRVAHHPPRIERPTVMARLLALAIVKELLPLPRVEDHKVIGIADVDSLERARQRPILPTLPPIALRSVLDGAKNETSGTQLRSIGMWATRLSS